MTTGDLGFDAAPEHIIGFARSLGPDTEPHGWNEWFGGTPNAPLIRLYNEFQTATSEAELIRIAKEFDQHTISGHFQVWTGKAPGFQVAHPWVKGWNGETFVHPENYHEVLARLWLDRDLKAEMGFYASAARLVTPSTRDWLRPTAFLLRTRVAGTACHPFLCAVMMRGGELRCGRM